MAKFSRQLEAQMIPEWRDAFVNYCQLKKIVKKIKISLLQSGHPSSDGSAPNRAGPLILDHLRNLAGGRNWSGSTHEGDEENLHELEMENLNEMEEENLHELEAENLNEMEVENLHELEEENLNEMEEEVIIVEEENLNEIELLQSEEVKVFFEKLDVELVKVDNFYRAKETEFCERAKILNKQLQILLAKKELKLAMTTVRTNIPTTNTTKTISTIWKDILNRLRKEGSCDNNSGNDINRKKIQRAEEMIRRAFLELYKGLNLLETYSSLNMVAFTKILKKFRKVSNQCNSGSYMRKVKGSYFISSDKVVRLADDVESTFTKHFASNDRKKAMKFLRPQQPKDSPMITFLVGLFTGSFVALFSVYAILVHLFGIFSTTSTQLGYIETVYPVFSMFALLSLHIFLYGCNMFMWKSTRVSYNFILEFSPSTALKHWDAFLICASLMTTVVGAMIIQLVLKSSDFSRDHVDALPGVLLVLFIAILICPFNVLYRSTRYCFLRVMRNIIFSPFYKVMMVDFFMADQITSQIPLLRHMEYTLCYFISSWLKSGPYETCSGQRYKLLAYIISFLPYYCRAMQCVRRYIEEDYDPIHLANAVKQVSAIFAAFVRWNYAVDPSPFLLAVVIIVSTTTTIYQLYWDFVKDWGLFDLNSRNLWLRDELILKNKNMYYASMVLNFVLRLAWIETIFNIKVSPIENQLLDFLLASLEIIRRGHWNYYRLENEHLNNVGKFKVVKTVPLPFRGVESDD